MREGAVPTYIMLANWTDQGAQKVKESPRRLDTAKKALVDMGGEFKSIYMTMGEYDLIAVYDAPDDAVVARFMLLLGSRGSLSRDYRLSRLVSGRSSGSHRGLIWRRPGPRRRQHAVCEAAAIAAR